MCMHGWFCLYIICFYIPSDIIHRWDLEMTFRLQSKKWLFSFSIRGFFYDPRRNWTLCCLEVGIMNCGIRTKQIQMCKLSIEVWYSNYRDAANICLWTITSKFLCIFINVQFFLIYKLNFLSFCELHRCTANDSRVFRTTCKFASTYNFISILWKTFTEI